MALELYFHPFASFCQKALIACLRERHADSKRHVVDLGDDASRAGLNKLWPITKFRCCAIMRGSGRLRNRASSSNI